VVNGIEFAICLAIVLVLGWLIGFDDFNGKGQA